MTASGKHVAARAGNKRLRNGSRRMVPWQRMAPASESLRKGLESRGSRFLHGMLKLQSLTTYLGIILKDEPIRSYLMEKHPETLKRLENTLGYVQEQASNAESKIIPMWTVAQARKEIEELVSRARNEEPQVIGVGNRPIVVVVSARRWKAILLHHPEVQEELELASRCTKRHVRNQNAPRATTARRIEVKKVGKPSVRRVSA
jgi:prevent-host-death family protein